MKYFLLPVLVLLLLSCHNGNGNEVQKLRADSLAQEVLEQRLDIKELANSDNFMYYETADAQNTADIKQLTGIEKIKAQVVAYRIYKNLILEDNRYVFNAKSPLELHIPNDIFVRFERAFIASNNNVILSKDSIQLALPINFQDSVLIW